MKKHKRIRIGILLSIIAIGMFVFGASMFTYQGPPLNYIVNKLGMYSFIGWFPTLVIGIFLIIIGLISKK